MITDPRASFFRKPWVRVRSTVAMPPYSVARITGATEDNGEIVYTVATPNATAHDWYLVIGPGAINATTGMEGMATFLTTGGYVRYDDSDTPTIGEAWGPSNGSLEIALGGSGFWAIGGIETVAGNPVMAAIQNPAAAASSPLIYKATLGYGGSPSSNPMTITEDYDPDNIGSIASDTITIANIASQRFFRVEFHFLFDIRWASAEARAEVSASTTVAGPGTEDFPRNFSRIDATHIGSGGSFLTGTAHGGTVAHLMTGTTIQVLFAIGGVSLPNQVSITGSSLILTSID